MCSQIYPVSCGPPISPTKQSWSYSTLKYRPSSFKYVLIPYLTDFAVQPEEKDSIINEFQHELKPAEKLSFQSKHPTMQKKLHKTFMTIS